MKLQGGAGLPSLPGANSQQQQPTIGAGANQDNYVNKISDIHQILKAGGANGSTPQNAPSLLSLQTSTNNNFGQGGTNPADPLHAFN